MVRPNWDVPLWKRYLHNGKRRKPGQPLFLTLLFSAAFA